MDYSTVKKQIRDRILSEMDYSRQLLDEEVLDQIDEEILAAGKRVQISVRDMKRLRQDLFHSIRKLDVLQDLIEDPEITEIMINGMENIFVEKKGRILSLDARFSSAEKLGDVIQQIVSACNRTANELSPIVDARLEDGSRVNVVLPPAAINGPILTIRRFPERPIQMRDLLEYCSISAEIAEFLRDLVRAGYNIFVSGGTGSGKTTFLNALSEYIPETERVITIEDNAELQIRHIPNLVRLEARNANVEGNAEITIRDLMKASLRMRPDRIVVGEVRGSEAIDMIQAMNSGHDGSMSTGHANSAKDMLRRLETMILMGMDIPSAAVRGQLASAIDLLVHLGRLRDHSRRLLEIAEVTGVENSEIIVRTLYRFYETGEKDGRIQGGWKKEADLQNTEKLRRAGIAVDPGDRGARGVGGHIETVL